MISSQIREYSIEEIRQEMDKLRKCCSLVRLVDAEECRTIGLEEDGIRYGNDCHDVWNSRERCTNCSSYQAAMTRTTQYKTEIYQHKQFDITSVPVYLRLKNSELVACIMELIRVHELSDEKKLRDTVTESPEFYRKHDALTRLYNQGEAFRRIRKRLMDSPEKSYLLISSNIRDFHMINVLFGRETGNAILAGIADILRQNCTEREIYAHTRADRFLLFIEKERFDHERVVKHISALQELIRSPVYTLKIHLGVYEITDPNLPLSIMLQRSEIALLTIRDSQTSSVIWYTEGLMEHQIEDQWIISEFQKSLLTDQFRVFYQPQVDMDGTILGAEALVRWIRHDGTQVPLTRFLPVLSRSDLITRMDERVWELAVMQLAAWKGTPLENLYISVNIEPKDFLYIDVPEKLQALCGRFHADIRKLHVEITERALADESVRPEEIILALHEKGLTVEIDDFGKGSSSLSMLKDLPADVLKIDMGFLRETEQYVRSKIILESVVNMAKRLETEVIVEGVETDTQKQGLREMGCLMYQGFLFSRPLPAGEFEKLYLESLNNRR